MTKAGGPMLSAKGEITMDDRLEYKGPKTGKPGCSQCGGRGTVLVDVSRTLYANRAERRRAERNGEPMQKWLPCSECSDQERVK
jgi:hypothetical protein